MKLNIALYRPRSSPDGLGSGRVPVALGIKGYQLYMSCVLSGAEPVLQLEVSGGSHRLRPTALGGCHPTLNPISTPSLAGSRHQEGH